MSPRLHIVVSEGLRDRVDAVRGPGQSRGDWVRRVLERELDRGDSNRRAVEWALESSGVEPRAPGMSDGLDVVSPAPAEQPVAPGPIRDLVESELPRGSRPFRPYPKGGK